MIGLGLITIVSNLFHEPQKYTEDHVVLHAMSSTSSAHIMQYQSHTWSRSRDPATTHAHHSKHSVGFGKLFQGVGEAEQQMLQSSVQLPLSLERKSSHLDYPSQHLRSTQYQECIRVPVSMMSCGFEGQRRISRDNIIFSEHE